MCRSTLRRGFPRSVLAPELVEGRAGKRLVGLDVIASRESASTTGETAGVPAAQTARVHDSFRFCLPGVPALVTQRENRSQVLAGAGFEPRRVGASLRRSSQPERGDIGRNLDGWFLKLDQVDIHDNFFDLGGHSLLVAQVNSRMREVFQSELPLRQLFEFPIIAQLAAVISACSSPRKSRSETMPCSPAATQTPPVVATPNSSTLSERRGS